MQIDLSRVVNWCRENGLFSNPDKCLTIAFSRKTVIDYLNYVIDSVTLDKVDSIKDLGIIFDSKLKFHEHMDKAYNSTSNVFGLYV